MKNVLVVGASGVLGSNIILKLKKKYNIFAIENNSKILEKEVNVIKLNILRKKNIDNLIKYKFDIIFHAAGLVNVEECEKYPKKSFNQNYLLTKYLVDFSKKNKIYFIYISSDHIFNGDKKFYTEKSKTKALNVYAKHKIMSERYIILKLYNYLIIRTNFYLSNLDHLNKKKLLFDDFVIRKVKKKQKIYLWDDIFFTPIKISKLINCILKLISYQERGIYNLAGKKRYSKYQFGMYLLNKKKLNSKYVIRSKFPKGKMVLRPRDMSLSNKKYEMFLKEKENEKEI